MPSKFTLPPLRSPLAEPSKTIRSGVCCLMPWIFWNARKPANAAATTASVADPIMRLLARVFIRNSGADASGEDSPSPPPDCTWNRKRAKAQCCGRACRLPMTQCSAKARESPSLMLDPNGHTRLEACRLPLRIDAQAQRIAVMIANNPLGLPGGKDAERPQFGDDAFDRAIGTVPHHAHCFSDSETTEIVFAGIERKPLPACRLDHQDRLTRANILAHLGSDHADHTVGWSTQDHLFKTPLKHRDRGRRGLHLRVGDRTFLPGRARHGRIVIRLGLRHTGTRTCSLVFGLVKRLLGLKALTCQRAGPCELGLHVVEAGACFGDCSFQRVDLFATDSDIDVVAVRGCRCECSTRLVRLRRQLHGGEPRQDIARMYAGAFLDHNRYELAVHLRLHPHFGRPHDANDCGRRIGTTPEADQGTREKHEYDCTDRGTPSFAHVPVLS